MRSLHLELTLALCVVIPALGAGCGGAADNASSFSARHDASVATSGNDAMGPALNLTLPEAAVVSPVEPQEAGDDAGDAGDGGDSTVALTGPMALTPANDSIDIAYGQPAAPLTYVATIGGQTVPASFSIDRGEIGSIAAATGVLTLGGTLGGTATVTATYNGMTVSTPIVIRITLVQNGPAQSAGAGDGSDGGSNAGDAGDGGSGATNNSGGNGGVGGQGLGGPVTAATQTVLTSAPAADATLGWLYPYDKTVWPRGLLAPLLQWTTQLSYDAVYVHLSETAFDYQGFFSATATPFVSSPIPQSAWDLLAYSNQGESVSVTVVFSSAGQVYGPLTETWSFAGVTVAGTVYYNSYGTNLAHNYTSNGVTFGGATLGIKPGATSPVLVAGNDSECRVCHSVSADGSRLVTQQQANAVSSTYDLKNGYAETVMSPGDSRYAWGALSPNGAFLMTDGARGSGSPFLQGGGWNGDAQLFALPSGAAYPSTGIPAGLRAASPVFSPDGKHVAFNFYGGTVPVPAMASEAGANDDSGAEDSEAGNFEAGESGAPAVGTDAGALVADGVSLAMMDYEPATSTFSNFQILFTPPSGYSVWPSFLPTNGAVVFELETHNNGRDWGGTRSPCDSAACLSGPGTQAEIWWVDVATKKAARLDALNGKMNGVGYLPTLPANLHTDDTILNYEPTVNPVPGGGYAWIVFTSRRLYGNVATIPPYWSDPRFVDLSKTPTTKKLWVAALDLSAAPGTDGSHPAFYLPGQELLAGNSRGYWVVDPCKSDGNSCVTGDQCCNGYCENVGGGLVCSAQPPACSNLNDKCASDSDCCGVAQGTVCINSRCADVTPPPASPPSAPPPPPAPTSPPPPPIPH